MKSPQKEPAALPADYYTDEAFLNTRVETQALFQACRAGDVDALKKRFANHQGDTATKRRCLQIACEAGQHGVFSFLMGQGVALEQADEYLLLHHACLGANRSIVESLLRMGLNQNIMTDCFRQYGLFKLPIDLVPEGQRETMQSLFNQCATEATRALRKRLEDKNAQSHPLYHSIARLGQFNGVSADRTAQSKVDALYEQAAALLDKTDAKTLNEKTASLLYNAWHIADQLNDKMIFLALQKIYLKQGGHPLPVEMLGELAEKGCLHQLAYDFTKEVTPQVLHDICVNKALKRANREDLKWLLEKGVDTPYDELLAFPDAERILRELLTDHSLFIRYYDQVIRSHFMRHPTLRNAIYHFLVTYQYCETLAGVLPHLVNAVRQPSLSDAALKDTLVAIVKPLKTTSIDQCDVSSFYAFFSLFNKLLSADSQLTTFESRARPFDSRGAHAPLIPIELACYYDFQSVLFALIESELKAPDLNTQLIGRLFEIAHGQGNPKLFEKLLDILPIAAYYQQRTDDQPCLVSLAIHLAPSLVQPTVERMRGVGEDTRDAVGDTSLHHAVRKENTDAIITLVCAGWHFDVQNFDGRTPASEITLASVTELMERCVESGHSGVLKRLFDARVFGKEVVEIFGDCLANTRETNNSEGARLLIEFAQARWDKKDPKYLAYTVQRACELGWVDVLSHIRDLNDSISQGAILRQSNIFKYSYGDSLLTPLETAAAYNQIEVLDWMQQHLRIMLPQSVSPLEIGVVNQRAEDATKIKLIEMGELIPLNYPDATEQSLQRNAAAQLQCRHQHFYKSVQAYVALDRTNQNLNHHIFYLTELLNVPSKDNADLLEALYHSITQNDNSTLIKAAKQYEQSRVGNSLIAAVLYAVAAIVLLFTFNVMMSIGLQLGIPAPSMVDFINQLSNPEALVFGGLAAVGMVACAYQAVRFFAHTWPSTVKQEADTIVGLITKTP